MPNTTYPIDGVSAKNIKTITVNIGLENNPMTIDQLTYSLTSLFANSKFKVAESEYLGAFESTLVMEFQSSNSFDYLKSVFSGVCVPTEQECIAIHNGDEGALVYPPDYTGEKYEFVDEFFVNFFDKL